MNPPAPTAAAENGSLRAGFDSAALDSNLGDENLVHSSTPQISREAVVMDQPMTEGHHRSRIPRR